MEKKGGGSPSPPPSLARPRLEVFRASSGPWALGILLVKIMGPYGAPGESNLGQMLPWPVLLHYSSCIFNQLQLILPGLLKWKKKGARREQTSYPQALTIKLLAQLSEKEGRWLKPWAPLVMSHFPQLHLVFWPHYILYFPKMITHQILTLKHST